MFQQFLIYLVITVLMTPLLLFYGIPFIIVARVLHRYSALWWSARTRFVLCCGVASLGIAPAYDVYRAPRPIYTWLIQGDEVGAGFMVASFLVTWGVVMLQLKTLHGHRHAAKAA